MRMKERGRRNEETGRDEEQSNNGHGCVLFGFIYTLTI